ncbi:MAG: NAD(P)-dependent oxidoreductase [Blastochloris sp.]|nr:NAD(P)-dependent oxidoreductase [Blastochloris sp.]
MNPTPVAIIGVGRMGANMARRLHEQHVPVTAVYDLRPEAARSLADELGCMAASTPAAATAKANIVLTVVTDDLAMRQLFQAQALLHEAAGKVFINCATVSPELHREVEALVEAVGAFSMEACMASSIPQAREGSLYLMCGGRKEVFERVAPLLQILSKTCRYIGPAGNAAQVKALVNMVMNINTAGLAEGLGLGQSLGLDLTMLREVFSETGAASRVLQTDGEDMQNREHSCFFSAAHAAKDSGIALNLARQHQLTLPLAEATLHQYQRMMDLGLGELDKSGIAELTFHDRSPRSA